MLPGVEPERVEPALQRPHVVAAQQRPVHEEGPVAEPETGFDELSPRVGTDEAVDMQVAFRLERPDGGVGAGAESAAELLGGQFVPEVGQPLLDVDDLGAVVAPAKDPHPCSLRPARRAGNELTTGGSSGRARSRPSASHR